MALWGELYIVFQDANKRLRRSSKGWNREQIPIEIR
jgi:hypothetical protein